MRPGRNCAPAARQRCVPRGARTGLGLICETKPTSHHALTMKDFGSLERCMAAARRSLDPEMEPEDGIVVFGGDALAAGHSLRGSGFFEREGLLDAEFAGQDAAMECTSPGIGNALVGEGHGKFSVVTFREIGKNCHSIHLGLSVARRNRENGRLAVGCL